MILAAVFSASFNAAKVLLRFSINLTYPLAVVLIHRFHDISIAEEYLQAKFQAVYFAFLSPFITINSSERSDVMLLMR